MYWFPIYSENLMLIYWSNVLSTVLATVLWKQNSIEYNLKVHRENRAMIPVKHLCFIYFSFLYMITMIFWFFVDIGKTSKKIFIGFSKETNLIFKTFHCYRLTQLIRSIIKDCFDLTRFTRCIYSLQLYANVNKICFSP